MKINQQITMLNKVIACVLILAFIITTCAVPVNAEVETWVCLQDCVVFAIKNNRFICGY